MLTLALEQFLSKERILEFTSTTWNGATACSAPEAAARHYRHKSAADLAPPRAARHCRHVARLNGLRKHRTRPTSARARIAQFLRRAWAQQTERSRNIQLHRALCPPIRIADIMRHFPPAET